MKTKLIGGFIAACLIGAANTMHGADMSVNSGDEHFFREFWRTSLEVQRIGQLAQRQSQNAQVQALGQKVVQDYRRATQQAAATAQTLGAGEAPQISGKAVRELNKLAGLSGVAFDQAALRALFKCEEACAQQLDIETSNSGDLALRQLAALLQISLEPDLWHTAQLDADLNGHVRL